MTTKTSARVELQARYGTSALDDVVWQDVRLFETIVAAIASDIWDLNNPNDNHFHHLLWRQDHTERERLVHITAEQFRSRSGQSIATRAAATFLLHPQCWQSNIQRSNYDDNYYRRQLMSQIYQWTAEHCLQQQTPSDWVERLAQRCYDLCTISLVADEAPFGMILGHLLAAKGAAMDRRIAALLDALSLGEWEQAWRAITRFVNGTTTSNSNGVARIKAFWQAQGTPYAITLLARRDMEAQLDMGFFRRLLEVLPDSLPIIDAFVRRYQDNQAQDKPPASPWQHQLTNTRFITKLQKLVDDLLWELVSDFRPESWPVLYRINQLRGGQYLLRLAEEAEQRGLTELNPSRYGYWHRSQDAASAIAYLLTRIQRSTADDSSNLVPLLQRLQVWTLLAILPHVRPYEADICAALGWPGCLQLVALLHQLETGDPANSTDPSVGVVQREAILNIVEQLGEEHTRIILDAFAPHASSAALLIQAVLGWNRAEVRRMFGRRRLIAARALPLLPFEKGDTLLKRYLALSQFGRDANTSAAGRKAGMRAAMQTGLTNLALHAGYADATRLEWAMQDQLGSEGVSLGRQWQIEGYTLTLLLRNNQPTAEVRNESKILKRTPSAVTRDFAYREVRDTLDQLKDQQRRYTQAFLSAMRRGEALSIEELALLRRNPLASALLERLVLRTAGDIFGLYRAEDNSLEGYREERVLIDGPVYIAHPYDLAEAGVLDKWQAEIVRRQLVQPFKQVFRELYVITPAELTARYASSRVAGRRLKGRQATAVLANLGWQVDGGGTVSKPFYELGYQATFETGSYYYYGEDDDDYGAPTGELEFWPLNWQYDSTQRERRIPLNEIPARIFSEVMRDLDLVTVVAHQSEEYGSSKEVLQRRGDLVRATVAALGLKHVTVDEPHVFVQGSRASYRVHLATAAIYIEGGSYLCIVPAAKQRKTTYLPFEDGGDSISSELISKVLLLANDATIKDTTILAQIPPARRAA